MESTVVSVEKRVKLHTSEQWMTWLSYVRSVAVANEVWNLVDPDLTEEQLEKPIEKTTMPKMPDGDVTNENSLVFRTWGYRMDAYKIVVAELEKQKKGLKDVNQAIIQSVHSDHLPTLEDKDTARERLVFLKTRFGQSTDRLKPLGSSGKLVPTFLQSVVQTSRSGSTSG